jgi:hypothetical protein
MGLSFNCLPIFLQLAAGNYTLTTKNADGCTGKLPITINGYGAKFYAVRTIVNGYCGPCHLNGTVNGGKNFDADNDIVSIMGQNKSKGRRWHSYFHAGGWAVNRTR